MPPADDSPRGRRISPGEVPEYSAFWSRMFLLYLRRYFAKSFRAVRTSGPGLSGAGLAGAGDRPLVVYANHPSWWDPIHFFLLGSFVAPGRRVYGPMDAAALEKYRFFTKLGAFGIDRTPRGVSAFLRTGRAILDAPGASLWLTAEGRFADPRQRPVKIMSGLGYLARRLDGAWVVPLAVEYPFWNERFPEALTRFGKPIDLAVEPERPVEQWTDLFEARLERTMEALAEDARSRDPARFATVVDGRVGIGGVYDGWRRGKALVRGRSFDAAHGDGVP